MTRRSVLALFVLVAVACKPVPTRSTAMAAPAPRPLTPLRVLTLGDSLAYGTGDESGKGIAGRLRDELKTVETTNLGVNGAVTSDLIARLKQQRTRDAIASADAIVLSIGANDLFRTPGAREETLRSPLLVADRILRRIDDIVREIHSINPDARILILGGYNPVPRHPQAALINQYLEVWDEGVAGHFRKDPRVKIVKISDLAVPSRLSRLDSFHPGGSAYSDAAKRIAQILSTNI